MVACVLVVACGGEAPGPRAAPGPGEAPAARQVLAIADRVLADQLEQHPDQAAFLRPLGARYDDLPDESPGGVQAREARIDGWLEELRRVDRSGLRGAGALAYDAALERLQSEKGSRVCRYELWRVSPTVNGWVQNFAALAQAQPVGTDDLRAQALARYGKMAGYLDVAIADLREGEARGYVAYELSARGVVEQIDRLLATPVESSPLLLPAERDGTPEFRARLLAVVRDAVLPAIVRYRDFLATEYVAHARPQPGVRFQKDGGDCYRAALRNFTTLDIDPQTVHDTGWAELAKIEAEMKQIAARSFGGADLPALLEKLRTDPAFRYRDKDEMIAQAKGAIGRARAAIPTVFGLLPPDDVHIEPIPPFLEKTSAHHYQRAALDGTRAATYRIRLYQADQQSKVLGESIAFHEAIPGHHLQLDIASHRGDDLPPLLRFGFNSGYSEGWALYAEQLADEMGLYSSDAERLGMLSNRAWRAVRLIVDSGIHWLGWDRRRALDTMLAHTATSPDMAAAEVDRYIAWPGQACAYMLGYLEITRLRDEAKRELGARFDLRKFHDRVLENGAVPLPVLSRTIEAWIASERGR